MCTKVGSDASSDSELTFFMVFFCRKLSKHRFLQDFSILPKTFHPVVQTIKVNWASWRPLDCPEKHSLAFRVSLGLRLVLWPKYSRCSAFFSIVFALGDNFTAALITLKIASSVCLLLSFTLSWVPMWPRGAPESLLVEFSENNYPENTAFFLKIFVSGFVVLYLTHSFQISKPRCSETAFAKQRLASADFWDDNIFFLSQFLFDIYLEPLLLSHGCFLPNLPIFSYLLSEIA